MSIYASDYFLGLKAGIASLQVLVPAFWLCGSYPADLQVLGEGPAWGKASNLVL